MKIFLLFLIFVSNNAMQEVKIGSSTSYIIPLSPSEDAYFYLKHDRDAPSTIYFYFLFDSKSIRAFETCSTNILPTSWSSCEGNYKWLTEEHHRSDDGKYEFYEYGSLTKNTTYLIVKYPERTSGKFEVKASFQDFYDKIKKENERTFLNGLMIFIYIVIPSVALIIIIIIIVCCCICMRKKRTQGMVYTPPPNMMNNNYNPMAYSNIAPTPVTQENLLYNKPA